MEKRVAVLGAGSMGTALAQVIASNGQAVHLWSIELDVLEDIRDQRRNSKYLSGLELHSGIEAKWELKEALAEAWLAAFTVPSQIVRGLAEEAAPCITHEQAVLNVAKGLEEDTHPSTDSGQALRMSQVLAQTLPGRRIATMGGPAIAAELARRVPTAVVVAAEDAALAQDIRAALENEAFKVETSADLCGVELGATLKNVYAIALGMCDGAGYGTNTKAFLVSVALAEMARLCQALGGQPQTMYGLAGLGDLITTGFNPGSRNRTLGEKLARGADWQEFARTHTVEGIEATRAIKDLAERAKVRAPLLEAIHALLFKSKPPTQTLRSFLGNFAFD